MRLGLITSGGDCPGLNALIRAVTKRATREYDDTVIGFQDGWLGLLEDKPVPLTFDGVSGILHVGGTILRTSRVDQARVQAGLAAMAATVRRHRLDAVIIAGGDGTLRVAEMLWRESEAPIIGIPKTIDNDVCGTDQAIGFSTAVQIATDAIDRLHSTASSHSRTMVVEVMGRQHGHLAVAAGLAGGADAILIPELPLALDELVDLLRARAATGRWFGIVVVAESFPLRLRNGERLLSQRAAASDGEEHVGLVLSRYLAAALDHEARPTILGYVQRGGTPSAEDRLLATRLGWHAVDYAHQGLFGRLVTWQGDGVSEIPLATAARGTRPVDEATFRVAQSYFG